MMKGIQRSLVVLSALGLVSIQHVQCALLENNDRHLQIDEKDGSGAELPATEGEGACFAGWDTSCQNNPNFRSVMGANCDIHERFDCTMLGAIGYTEEEVYDVITNCPCSCKVECGQWTITPSAAPSAAPSSAPSEAPTSSPSSAPSSSPSMHPSQYPTSPPSFEPSVSPSESPSSAPSHAPTVSFPPTSSPSSAPTTSEPTPSPSGSPTTSAPSTSPTNAPTASPTISIAPSIDETVGIGEGSSNGGVMAGILAAFAGATAVGALAYFVNRGGLHKPWGRGIEPRGSYDTENTIDYNGGVPTMKSKKKNGHGKDNDNTDSNRYNENGSVIDNICSLEAQDTDDRTADAYGAHMMVEDRLEFVQFPTLSSSGSSSSDISFELDVPSSKSREYIPQHSLEMIAEVDMKVQEEAVEKEDDGDSCYGADVEDLHRPEAHTRQRRQKHSLTPPRPDVVPSSSSTTSSVKGRPPLYVNPSFTRSESIGRTTMLPTPQSVDSQESVEMILPHDGSI